MNGVGNQAQIDMEAQLTQYESIYNTETSNAAKLSGELEALATKMQSASAQYDSFV